MQLVTSHLGVRGQHHRNTGRPFAGPSICYALMMVFGRGQRREGIADQRQ
jgi:hypothetical protein